MCPLGCNVDDTEKHALLECTSVKIRDVPKFIFQNYKEQKHVDTILNFWRENKFDNFDILMTD